MSGRAWSVVLVAVAAVSVYLAYEMVIVPRRALQDQIRALEQDKQRLEAYLKILKHIDRRARIEVVRQAKDQQGNLQTTIRFTETDADGKPVSVSREMTLPGQEIYFDTLVIKFEDHFVEQGDPLKGHALMLFRRIFSNTMRAEDGFVIDKEGQPPEIYAGRQAPTAFEQDLWRRFWEFANDEKLAKEHGVRAIHGDAPYMRLEPDRVYEISLRSTGEVIISPGTRLATTRDLAARYVVAVAVRPFRAATVTERLQFCAAIVRASVRESPGLARWRSRPTSGAGTPFSSHAR